MPLRIALHEQVLLLATHDEKGTLVYPIAQLGMAAAGLAELVNRGKLQLDDSTDPIVTVSDSVATSDPALDAFLEAIDGSKRPRKLSAWIQKLSGTKGLHQTVAEPLVSRGLLVEEERRVLGLFPTTRYPAGDPTAEADLVERIQSALSGQGDPDDDTRLVISIAVGAEILHGVFGAKEVRSYKERIAEIMEGEPFGLATCQALDELRMAQTAATITATT